ncbi:caspase, EACC1-associated type [Saccharopolyspora endophytica]|uniref:caspase, EACC1-associated type n=1 Tax=Saccharopolyspora endophytica TaxID=543886 RepID=UPI0027DC415D|nr:FtsK/SpoIIIE domain-containing protein [Saccharopolyspora endophytica]
MNGRRIALLFATSRYLDSGLQELRAPAGEAQELRQVLETQGDYDATVFVDESKSGIEGAIERTLSTAGPRDEVLLYFSCHGIKNDSGRLFFAACNTDLGSVEATAVSSTFVHSQLSGSQAGAKLVMLDCCYSGAFSLGMTPKAAYQVDHHQLSGRGTYVITATSALEYAFENRQRTSNQPVESLFTKAVLRGIRSGAADVDGDDLITADELYRYVHRELKDTQTPWQDGRVAGDLIVARVGNRASRIQPVTAPQATLGDLLEHPEIRSLEPPAVTLQVSVGVTRSRPHLLSFAEPNSHLAVLGPSQSGKSRFLRTLLLGLAADADPHETEIIIIDSESRFVTFENLPNVTSVVGPEESDRIAELFSELDHGILARRAMFRRYPFELLDDFRAMRRNREIPDGQVAPDRFLVIDRWETFADENPELINRVEQIADKGTAFGVHVVVATRSRARLSNGLAHHVQQFVELRGRADANRPLEAATGSQSFTVAAPKLRGEAAINEVMPSVIHDFVRRGRNRGDRQGDSKRLLGVDVMADDPKGAWLPVDDLRIPIGLDAFDRLVHLDLRPEDEGGAGPHGLIFGHQGAGSSNTLSVILLMLMLTHSPDDLHVALLHEGPVSPFGDLSSMPHVVARAGSTGVFRTGRIGPRDLRGIRSEIIRRKRGADQGTPTPKLVIAFHGVAAASEEDPDMVEILRDVMEQGRAVGVHVLLLAHRITNTRAMELVEHCDFRVVHRSPETEVSTLLGSVAAAVGMEKAQPGQAYLRVRDRPLTKLRIGTVDLRSRGGVIDRIKETITSRPPELLDPLKQPLTLSHVLGEVVENERGLSASQFARADGVPIGVVDVPAEGRTEPLAPVGNIALCGGPYSGKAWLAQTIVLSQVLTRTPAELNCYFIGADTFSCRAALIDLPHVRASARFDQSDHIAYILQQIGARNGPAGQKSMLVIEQWGLFELNNPQLLPHVKELAGDGKHVTVVVSAEQFTESDQLLLESVPTILELDRATPGAGKVNARDFRAATPWLGDDTDPESADDRAQAFARRIADAWPHAPLLRLETPPEHVQYTPVAMRGRTEITLGRLVGDRWAEFDWSRAPHMICLGGPGSGKTNLTRIVLAELQRVREADSYATYVLDPRRGLLDEVGTGWGGYAVIAEEFDRLISEVITGIKTRLDRAKREVPRKLKDQFVIVENYELIESANHMRDPLRQNADVLARGGSVGVHLIVTRNSINIGDSLNTGLLAELRQAGSTLIVLGGDERDGEHLPGVPSIPRPPGRGLFVRGETVEPVQISHA